MSQAEQILIDALPASGDVSYESYADALSKAGNSRALSANFHQMRKDGKIFLYMKQTPDGAKPYVSRLPKPVS